MIERGPVPAGDLPLFPFTNAAQLFHAQAQYLASDEVQGLRFISQHAQDTRPVNSVATSLRVDSDTAQIGERAASSFLPAVAPPVGLVYGSSDGLWRLGTDGESQLLTERIDALPSPDAAHAVYIDDGHRLWLMDLADGSERQLAAGIDLSWLYNWGDDHTMRLNNPAWSPNGSQVAWLLRRVLTWCSLTWSGRRRRLYLPGDQHNLALCLRVRRGTLMDSGWLSKSWPTTKPKQGCDC
ncbi:MAG TPA: hypothetical protein VLE70_06500 [Anaerolineae bacterium]|nr:hypothetical protein [Anaerolineae bacterium]